MSATIPLAKGFSEKHLKFPVFLSQKFDGVPVRIELHDSGCTTFVSRQGETLWSVEALIEEFAAEVRELHGDVSVVLVGEIIQRNNPFAPFKDTSGIVRRKTDQSNLLEIVIFDGCPFEPDEPFIERAESINSLVRSAGCTYVNPVVQTLCKDSNTLHSIFDSFMALHPNAEGMVARSFNDKFEAGKRSWGYQKLLREPTIDLRIVGATEAVTADGEPKGMVGRLIASYNGEEIGIGPGKLSHAERIALWKFDKELDKVYHTAPNGDVEVRFFNPRVAKIKYKDDPSYSALRQPTFQHWHEKDEPDA